MLPIIFSSDFMKHWGHVKSEDNKALDAAALHLKTRVKLIKKPVSIESEIRLFMKKYLAIGEDPTDTVIRDNVWTFLKTTTRNKLSHEELDTIWMSEVDNTYGCIIS